MYVSSKTGRSSRVIIKKASVVSYSSQNKQPAGILNENLDVCCRVNAVRIEELKPAGSSLMSFGAFINGRAGQPGDLFLSLEKVLERI